jgi:hypothetical protein
MMHPDHYEEIMRICRVVLIVWICVLSYKFGQGVYHELRYGLQ